MKFLEKKNKQKNSQKCLLTKSFFLYFQYFTYLNRNPAQQIAKLVNH